MIPVYRECSAQMGSGTFNRMKLAMDRYLNVKGKVIFRQSADLLLSELVKLQLRVVGMVKAEVESLKGLIEDQYVPFWKKRRSGGGGGGGAAAERERASRGTGFLIFLKQEDRNRKKTR